MDTSPEPPHAKPALRPAPGARSRWTWRADWTVGVAAGVLLLTSLSGWLYHRVQLADIAADHLRLRVTGPARLRPGLATDYEVTTTSVTGRPIPAQVDFAVYSAGGEQLRAHNEKTDEKDGRLTVTLPADLEVGAGVKLHLAASHREQREEVTTLLAAEPVRYATYLATDRSVYRPGQSIDYHSLTLSRFALTPDREMLVQFEILDPGGTPKPKSQAEAMTSKGVARGRFTIPDELPGGEYTLVGRSAKGEFPEQRRTFFIRRDPPSRLKTELEFDRTSYAPGDTVIADFSARSPDGVPAAGVPLRIRARVDGELVHEEQAETSNDGTFRVEFPLADEIREGDAQLFVVAAEGDLRETSTKRIPLQTGPIDVRFYPEGGCLVAELENRVYFTARNPLGEPVEVSGRIVNGKGQLVARANTTHAGLGSFAIYPLPAEEYRLEYAGAPDGEPMPKLPDVSTGHEVVLSMGLGVFGQTEPLEFNVRASKAGLPLVASAWCRGVPVGHQLFVTGEKDDANPVAVALDDRASGVIQLSIYDYSSNPPEPVAHRLIYRQPTRPGDAEQTGAEEARAALPSDETPPDALAHFLLVSEIDAAPDLDDLGFYLLGSGEANAALDLLLGAQASRPLSDETRENCRHDRGVARPPAVFDNLIELQERYKESLAAYRAHQTRTSNTLTTVSFLGGLGLLVLVAMLNLLNIAGGPRIWATAIAAATVSLIIGGILMDPGRWKTAPEGAAAFISFDMVPASLTPVQDPSPQETDETNHVTAKTLSGTAASDPRGQQAPVSGEPGEDRTCSLRLSTRLTDEKVLWGDGVRLVVELANTGDASQPMAVAVLRLPAGCRLWPDQLRRLKKAGKIDYYQTRPHELACYWRSLDPNEVIQLELDLIAAAPGQYSPPASSAYLRDFPQQKRASDPLVLEITRE